MRSYLELTCHHISVVCLIPEVIHIHGSDLSIENLTGESHRSATAAASFALRLLAVVFGGLMTLGCGNPYAILNFTVPPTVSAGSPFSVTVTATINGERDTIINSYISFTSSDPAAILPDRYQFTPADAGSHTWPNGFTLKTGGNQTISATIYDAAGINGSANVTVTP